MDFTGERARFPILSERVYFAQQCLGATPAEMEADLAAYAASIAYSLRTVVSFVERYGDEDTVLVVLGDHQPSTVVTGQGASHDVPISLIARDPKVVDRIASWGWQDGMLPSPDAPVWPMQSFRDRFLTAFGP